MAPHVFSWDGTILANDYFGGITHYSSRRHLGTGWTGHSTQSDYVLTRWHGQTHRHNWTYDYHKPSIINHKNIKNNYQMILTIIDHKLETGGIVTVLFHALMHWLDEMDHQQPFAVLERSPKPGLVWIYSINLWTLILNKYWLYPYLMVLKFQLNIFSA